MATTTSLKCEVHASRNGNRIQPTDETMASNQATKILMTDDYNQSNDGSFDICGWILIVCSYILVILTFPITIFICINVVQEYQRAVIFRLGRIIQGGAKGPGLFFILPCVDTIVKVDLRTTTFNVPPQEVLTRDSVTVSVDAVVYSRIVDPVTSVTKVNNVYSATQLLAQTTLRNMLGTKTLQDILSDREAIANLMEAQLDEGSSPWGIKVERVEITDVRLPQSMQRSMAAEAEASREARAKVIAAEGEQKASRQLKEAADVIAQSPIALQLRYLQTLTQISAEKNSTIVFPIPVELLSLVNKGR
ncbi:unnamed protein product [Adineta steineri]|uniref:Band 7 domain-containing protein n=1 Tax=Adineta steineri TaxID=433720 RepID=A0A814B2J5_9BILA|nr:unnamed protein product [Adineta steineri]CAF3549759.1 unnamed protein product [Adineta steineri]CAF3814783.1 unnamed protein product [Adineta steineri]